MDITRSHFGQRQFCRIVLRIFPEMLESSDSEADVPRPQPAQNKACLSGQLDSESEHCNSHDAESGTEPVALAPLVPGALASDSDVEAPSRGDGISHGNCMQLVPARDGTESGAPRMPGGEAPIVPITGRQVVAVSEQQCDVRTHQEPGNGHIW